MIHPCEQDVGRGVIYRTAPAFEAEFGIITSFNDHCVWVRYGKGPTSQATDRSDLEWEFPKQADAPTKAEG